MTGWLFELRCGLRRWVRRPHFAFVLAAMIALGVGASVMVFSWVDAALLRPLPYGDPDRLMVLWEDNERGSGEWQLFSWPDFDDLQQAATSYESLAASRLWEPVLTGRGTPARVDAAEVSAGFLDTLGIGVRLGRGLRAGDFAPDAVPVVVLDHATWRSQFGGDSAVLGETVRLDGVEHTVVGVLPPRNRLVPPVVIEPAQLVAPLRLHAENPRRGSRVYRAIGRRTAAATPDAARRELSVLGARLSSDHPDSNEGWWIETETVGELTAAPLRRGLAFLLAGVGLLLLISCLNVTQLLLVGASGRQDELTVRHALGAQRVRLLRHLLLEALPLVGLGVAAGVLVGAWSAHLLAAGLPDDLAVLRQVSLDWRVAAVAAGLLVLTLVVVTVGSVGTLDPASAAGLATARSAGRRHESRLRSILAAAEVALALALLVAASLMATSFYRLSQVDLGFEADRLLTFHVNLPFDRYAAFDTVEPLVAGLGRQIEALPGAVGVSLVNHLPLAGGNMSTGVEPEGAADDRELRADLRGVGAGYFEVMGIRRLAGRTLEARDVAGGGEAVAVINRTAAEQYWPGRDAVGRRFTIGFGEPVERMVIGVVDDVRHEGAAAAPRPEIYLPYGQLPYWSPTFVVRTSAPPLSLVAPIRQRLQRLDDGLPLESARSMRQVVGETIVQQRLYAALSGAFALAALLLAGVGIYVILAAAVEARTREFGVRLSLGARHGDLRRLVLRQGGWISGAGVAAGLLSAWGLVRYLGTLVYGVDPRDPRLFAAAAVFVLLVSALAVWLPARRVMRLDPVRALRYE